MSTTTDTNFSPADRSRPSPDFIGKLRFLTTQEGGRTTPAHSGYRPHFKLPYKEWHTSCQQEFIDLEVVNPGDTVHAEMKILWTEAFEHCLAPGDTFTLGEGDRVVAHGQITQVLNPRLDREDALVDPKHRMRYLFFNDHGGSAASNEGKVKRSLKNAALSLLASIFPQANAHQAALYGKAVSWKVEFDLSNNWTSREIGYDAKGKAIVCAPFKEDLGLWTDHELTLEDYERFAPTVIRKDEFEEDWKKLKV